MALKCIPLHHTVDRRSAAYVRRLTGVDEQAVDSADTLTAVELIDRVCIPVSEDALAPGQAIDLTAHDRDRILVALYSDTYGPDVEGVATCTACTRPFDFSFTLDDLIAQLDRSRSSEAVTPLARFPTARDELAVAALAPDDAIQELVRRCVGDGSNDAQSIEETIATHAPILALELDARCPECDAVRDIGFDIQSTLLGSLLDERSDLAHEIHQLALTYGWSLHDILAMPRAQRKQFADLAAQASDAVAR